MRRLHWLLWLGLALLLTRAQIALNISADPATARTPLIRLMGPAAGLGRSIQWIRFQRSLLRGDHTRALALAESAVALDPQATDGWQLLVSHLGYFRASPQREHNLERRKLWFEAALKVAQRGALSAGQPEELHMQRGMMLLSKFDLDPELDERGPSGLLERAILALRQAEELGSREAADVLSDLEQLD